VSASEILIEDFQKLDIRVGIVKSAERIEGTKLLRLIVDVGGQERQIISGIAPWYSPEDLINRKVIVLANLKPKKIRGYESQGMILAAGCEEGQRPFVLTVEGDAPSGSKVC
jgi:methionyl-tRNA synthetase C-terminal region/beta chain